MAKNPDNHLTEEQQVKACEILETFGQILDPRAFADYLEASPRALDNFNRTNRAKAARQRYVPGTRESARQSLTNNSQSHQELAFPDTLPDGMHYIDVIPDNVVGAYALKYSRAG